MGRAANYANHKKRYPSGGVNKPRKEKNMGSEELEKQIENLENALITKKRQLEESRELEQNSFKMPLPEVYNISDEEIGKWCKSVSYFTAVNLITRQFGISGICVPLEFSSRSLAELVYRCTQGD